jgi:hypothetical protein
VPSRSTQEVKQITVPKGAYGKLNVNDCVGENVEYSKSKPSTKRSKDDNFDARHTIPTNLNVQHPLNDPLHQPGSKKKGIKQFIKN